MNRNKSRLLTIPILFCFVYFLLSPKLTEAENTSPVQPDFEQTSVSSEETTPRPSPTTQPSPTPAPMPSIEQQIVNYASQLEGYPYKYGEEAPENGFDCSGLVFFVYKHFGYPLYRTASDMHKNGIEVSMDELRPSDILLFKKGYWIYHCGIYLGDGLFIHAQDELHGVIVSHISEYSDRGIEIRRVVETVEPFTQDPFVAE